jgi:aspartate/methionine/tyrosine aminotransferase
MTRLPDFSMERWQSEWEHVVRYNLAESGVHPLSMNELIGPEDFESLLSTGLGYIQTDGTEALKQNIAGLYPGVTPENILVTTGSIEANFLSMWHLLEPNDSVLFMRPNFLQMEGLIQAFGARSHPFYLKEELDWGLDMEDLDRLKSLQNVRAIVVTDPNNPVGRGLPESQRFALEELANRFGAWLIVDEVYRGAEWEGESLPSWWGRYPKTIVTNGLSKAYGLPGLRVGWMVGPPGLIRSCWKAKDYTSITISSLSDRLAVRALEPERRAFLLERTKGIIRDNWRIFSAWMERQEGMFTCVPPLAGAIAFPRYHHLEDTTSSELAEYIRANQSVLICPGDFFGMDGFLRIGLGNPADEFMPALELLSQGMRHLKSGLSHP